MAISEAGEPNIAGLQDGGVLLTVRISRPENRRLVSHSPDGATAWSEPELVEELLERGCMAGICEHPGTASLPGPLLLFSNPNMTDHEHSARRNVTIKLSRDWAYANLTIARFNLEWLAKELS